MPSRQATGSSGRVSSRQSTGSSGRLNSNRFSTGNSARLSGTTGSNRYSQQYDDGNWDDAKQHSRYAEELRIAERSSKRRGSSRRSGSANKNSSHAKQRLDHAKDLPLLPAIKGGGNVKDVWKSIVTTEGKQTSSKGPVFAPHTNGFGQKVLDWLRALLAIIVKGLRFAGLHIVNACRKSKAFLAAFIIVALLVFGGAADSLTHIGKVYGHVSVGDVNASGMTPEELSTELTNRYGTSMAASGVTIFANEEAMANHNINPEDSGNLSVEEQAAQTTSWYTDKNSLQAYIDYNSLVEQAMQAGRAGFLDRLKLLFVKRTVDVDINYNKACIESLANEIDLALGYSYVNSELVVENGVATATESADGMMVDRNELKSILTNQFLNVEADQREFVANVVKTPAAITTEEGKAAAEKANTAIANGANFTYGGTSWTEDPYILGSWINTNIIEAKDGSQSLSVYFDPQKAMPDIAEYAKPNFANGNETIKFVKQDSGDIMVQLGSEGTMPQVNAAISKLNDALLGTNANTSAAPTIDIQSVDVPSEMYLNEAMNAGVVSVISEYTTEYTTGATERNNNIHLAADLIDNSIVEGNGGVWSFNETAGECNEEKGFQSAGSIVGGEATDEIGGGICQVGTTVFNAVYELGMPIEERHNHSMYISSYPAGRDAAISWPDLDLRWKNDTTSDMLLTTSYTDGSLTVSIYGIDPGYTVTSETGSWEAGGTYTTVYSYDDTLAPGYSYVKTYGSDGQSITVTRYVDDKAGNTLYEDAFVSVYDPTNEVIVRGGTQADWS